MYAQILCYKLILLIRKVNASVYCPPSLKTKERIRQALALLSINTETGYNKKKNIQIAILSTLE